MKKLFLGFVLLSCLSIQVKAEQYIKSIYVKFNATGKGVGEDIESEIKYQYQKKWSKGN